MQKRVYREEPHIIQKVREHGFKVFDKQDFDLNIIGVRNLQSKRANLFDDEIHIIYKERGFWVDEYGPATTDPGTYYLLNENYRPDDGVAILVHPQQILSGYVLGPHGKTGYTALVNRGKNPTKVWRDGNRDERLDMGGVVYEGYFGCNIHRASLRNESGATLEVGAWSAGCSVWQYSGDFEIMLQRCREQINRLGYKTFTYTLIAL